MAKIDEPQTRQLSFLTRRPVLHPKLNMCGILGLLLHDPLATQTSAAATEMYVFLLSRDHPKFDTSFRV